MAISRYNISTFSYSRSSRCNGYKRLPRDVKYLPFSNRCLVDLIKFLYIKLYLVFNNWFIRSCFLLFLFTFLILFFLKNLYKNILLPTFFCEDYLFKQKYLFKEISSVSCFVSDYSSPQIARHFPSVCYHRVLVSSVIYLYIKSIF